ncbi:MAG TPA: 50S ribosomal protein L11 methyltransferase [Prolixibacteraceae bacterium]|nr:50S ribosomal protein L11 methyltransferase [Prolixibacteraceae bacterium]
MDYQKVTIKLTPDIQDFRDVLISELAEAGYESFVENEDNIEAYITAPKYDVEKLKNSINQNLFSISFENELIPDQNWNKVWEENYFKPLVVANKCVIRAPFHEDYPNAEYEIVIEPKMAFGTGNHETTSLMMEYILEGDIKNKAILDMGCGTGILAMLASMRGAQKITAIDVDKWSYESTKENADNNNCNNIDAHQGDASLLGTEKFDVIFANIHKNVLIEDIKTYQSVLKNGGQLFMSGFYENDYKDITSEAKKLGMNPNGYKTKNKWVAAMYING